MRAYDLCKADIHEAIDNNVGRGLLAARKDSVIGLAVSKQEFIPEDIHCGTVNRLPPYKCTFNVHLQSSKVTKNAKQPIPVWVSSAKVGDNLKRFRHPSVQAPT